MVAPSNRINILKALSHQKFVSGQYIADNLGISRAAVNKHIKALAQYGIEVFQVTGKGYKLAEPVCLFNYTELVDALTKIDYQLSSKSIFYFPIIDSTNSYLVEECDAISSDLAICIADYQEQGRGRLGRDWLSPMGTNLTFSLSARFSLSLNELSTLSIRVGIAIVEAVKIVTGKKLQLKWPNDLYYQGHKLGGILIQLIGEVNAKSTAVIGIGLNVSNQPNNVSSDYLTTALNAITATEVSRYDLLSTIVQQLRLEFDAMYRHDNHLLIQRWLDYDMLYDTPVRFTRNGESINGIGKGIDHHGGYLVQLADNQIVSLYGGEISIRKL